MYLSTFFKNLNNILKVIAVSVHLTYELSFLPSSICWCPTLIQFCRVLKMKPEMDC